jgi:hypothetical protein
VCAVDPHFSSLVQVLWLDRSYALCR